MLRIAIPYQGRLKDESIALLDKLGIKLEVSSLDCSLARSYTFPLEVVFVENEIIPLLVKESVVDFGITSEYLVDVLSLSKSLSKILLGFDKAAISLFLPADVRYKGLEWFSGKVIATDAPDVVQAYMKEHKVRVKVRKITHNLYNAVDLSLADAICAKLHFGSYCTDPRLKEVETVAHTESVLIQSEKISPQNQLFAEEFLCRMEAVIITLGKKRISLNVQTDMLDKVLAIMPCLRSPKIYHYHNDPNFVSVSAVMDEVRFWDIKDKLKELGVKEIMITDIEKIIF